MSAASYGKAMIESRKRADNAYKEMDTVIANDKKILQIANFENTTAKTIDRLSKVVSCCQRISHYLPRYFIPFVLLLKPFQKDAEKQKQQYEYTVNERRQQLADLYNSELEMWRSEAISRVETQEDRKARCVLVF